MFTYVGKVDPPPSNGKRLFHVGDGVTFLIGTHAHFPGDPTFHPQWGPDFRPFYGYRVSVNEGSPNGFTTYVYGTNWHG